MLAGQSVQAKGFVTQRYVAVLSQLADIFRLP
jgi:hypothetical protein